MLKKISTSDAFTICIFDIFKTEFHIPYHIKIDICASTMVGNSILQPQTLHGFAFWSLCLN